VNSFQYIFLSFIQAATEFLPVSSSGHLLFFKGLFGAQDVPIIFDITVHVGSLVAILVFYYRRLTATLTNSWLELVEKRKEKKDSKMLLYLLISTIVTFIFYLIFKDKIEAEFQSPSVLPITYLVTTVILFSTYFAKKSPRTSIPQKGFSLPIIVGLFQGIAIFPGVSRSGSTISPLLLIGIEREEAAYYSFFLVIPAILGAFVFELSEIENMDFFIANWKILFLSFFISALFSYLFLGLLTFILKKGKFWFFSFYTLTLGIASLILF